MKDQSKYIKLLEAFTGKKVILEDVNFEGVDLEDDGDGPYFDYDNVVNFISHKLGSRPASYSGSADWGGIPVWPLGDSSNYVGTFIVFDDNDWVVLLERKLDPITQDTYIDKEISIAKDWQELSSLLSQIKK